MNAAEPVVVLQLEPVTECPPDLVVAQGVVLSVLAGAALWVVAIALYLAH